MGTCRCTPPTTCGKLVAIKSLTRHHTPNLNAIGQAVPEIQKLGGPVRTCRVYQPGTSAYTELMDPQLHAEFHHNRPSRYRETAGGTFVISLKPRAIVGTDMIQHCSYIRQEG